MDRDQISQTVALLVVLAALVRWIPDGGAAPAWLGLGDPHEALAIDAFAAGEVGRGDDDSRDPVRAMLRSGNPSRTPAFARWLAFAQQIVEQTPEDAVVQLKGISRNEGWILAYDVYPRRVIGVPTETGGGLSDATDPEATVVVVGGPAPYWEHVR